MNTLWLHHCLGLCVKTKLLLHTYGNGRGKNPEKPSYRKMMTSSQLSDALSYIKPSFCSILTSFQFLHPFTTATQTHLPSALWWARLEARLSWHLFHRQSWLYVGQYACGRFEYSWVHHVKQKQHIKSKTANDPPGMQMIDRIVKLIQT